jgi:hypothetical protein
VIKPTLLINGEDKLQYDFEKAIKRAESSLLLDLKTKMIK